jgi:hypothetical protein
MSSMVLEAAVGTALLTAVACGGSSPETKPAGAEQTEESAPKAAAEFEDGEKPASATEASAEGGAEIPTQCAKAGEVCTPPVKFAKRMCSDTYPTVALVLFAQGTPWTRGYLRGKTKAWNASGGASEQVDLEFDEEVLILMERKPDTGGMQVSGAGAGYEALRWDGTCVTLSSEEITLKSPPAAKYPKVEFKRLETALQDALREDATIDEAYKSRRQECKGQMTGTVSLKCVKADAKLAKLIVEYVRNGGKIPKPERVP